MKTIATLIAIVFLAACNAGTGESSNGELAADDGAVLSLRSKESSAKVSSDKQTDEPPKPPVEEKDEGACVSDTPIIDTVIELCASAEHFAFDGNGHLYFYNSAGIEKIRKIEKQNFGVLAVDGIYCDEAVAPTIVSGVSVGGMASGKDGNVYFSSITPDDQIKKIDQTTGAVEVIAGVGPFGESGDGGLAKNAKLRNPAGIFFDGNGNLYIADFGNDKIRKVDMTTGIIDTIAGIGQQNYDAPSADSVPATNTNLGAPNHLAVDGNETLYVSQHYGYGDEYERKVRRIDLTTGLIKTAAGTGEYGYSGDGGPATSAKIEANGIASDGNLYFSQGNRIRRVNTATGIIETIAGGDEPGFFGDGGPAISSKLSSVRQMFFKNGDLYFSDSGNKRIRKLTCLPPPSQPPPSQPEDPPAKRPQKPSFYEEEQHRFIHPSVPVEKRIAPLKQSPNGQSQPSPVMPVIK